MTKFLAALAVVVIWAAQVTAQERTEGVWIQIEARPSLAAGQARAQEYAQRLPDVAGFAVGAGWYGVALGPYARPEAEQRLRTLRSQGRIPADSFIVQNTALGQRFWPVGAPDLATRQITPEAPAQPDVVVQRPEPIPADETPREARRSERALPRAQKLALQVALQWSGVYQGKVDALFGPGTRAAMARWQTENGHEPTGILTTAQRAQLMGAYNAVLKGMDLQLVRDAEAGIEMQLPLGVVARSRVELPFVQYDATDRLPVQVLLISQTGGRDSLFGLYDILQTLELMPLEGPRKRAARSFEIEGRDARRHSYAYATRSGDTIKGFILVWPAGDEARRDRVLAAMRDSFRAIDGVLPDIPDSGESQQVDLLAGLEIRKPQLSRSGFYVSEDGMVVTSGEINGQCQRITLDDLHEAQVVSGDPQLGVTVLRPTQQLAPADVARLRVGVARLDSQVAVAGYPFDGILGAPSLTYGRLADIRGLNGEDSVQRLSLISRPGDIGGPVLDADGAVLGMLLPEQSSSRRMPEDVRFSTRSESLAAVLGQAGISVAAQEQGPQLDPVQLAARASAMTVLVQCWN